MPDHFLDPVGTEVVLGLPGRATAALGVWMAVWWLTETIELSATALLPLVVLPILGKVSIKTVAAPYASDLIFLFLGGFMLSLAMVRWNLHKRIALFTIGLFGSRPERVVAGFMCATAFLSMWLSNTATTLMLLPIATSILPFFVDDDRSKPYDRFASCLLLAIAYSASVGGVSTIIGTPPNALLIAFLRDKLASDISFLTWMKLALPVSLVFLVMMWWLMTKVLFPLKTTQFIGRMDEIQRMRHDLGPLTRGERVTGMVFGFVVVAWVTRPFLQKWTLFGEQPFAGLSDAGIAMVAALLLFTIPVSFKDRSFAMNWETTKELPWGILLLFGGGLSLAKAVDQYAVGQFLGSQMTFLAGLPSFLMIVLVVMLIIFLTELTSNLATTATFVPLLAALAPNLGVNPIALCVPAGIAASFAFMLPVATAPNAIVFSSGMIPIQRMSHTGFWLNLLGIVVISCAMVLLIGPVLGL